MLLFHQTLNLTVDRVTITRTDSTRKIVPWVEAAIEHAWHEARRRPGAHLFDGAMCRLESWTASEDRFSLALSTTGYKAFFGTNMSHPEFADVYGPEVMANPLGVSSALLTSDGFLIFGRRNTSVAYYPNRIHPFAGSMEPGDPDPFATVRRELAEELKLEESDIDDIRLIGLAEDRKLRQPELIFAVTSKRDRADIEADLDKIEHRGSWSVPAAQTDIELAISRKHELTPIATATLALWGRLKFGAAWFDALAMHKIQAGESQP